MYYEAETCVQAGDLDGAIEICTNIQEEKADADALFLRGRAYFLQKNYEQAKVDFDAAVETKESYQLCLDIYELYQESSMKADGDRYLEAAVKIEPKTTEDYYNIGCAYYYLKEQDEAVKAFSKAMKDGSSTAMEMLGEVYLSNGQNDEAKALFSSYLSTDGFAAAANNGLALCALAENDTDSALSYIEEGLKTAEDSDREICCSTRLYPMKNGRILIPRSRWWQIFWQHTRKTPRRSGKIRFSRTDNRRRKLDCLI